MSRSPSTPNRTNTGPRWVEDRQGPDLPGFPPWWPQPLGPSYIDTESIALFETSQPPHMWMDAESLAWWAAGSAGESPKQEPMLPLLLFSEHLGTPLFVDDRLVYWRDPQIGRRFDWTWYELAVFLRKSVACNLVRYPDPNVAKRARGGWVGGEYTNHHRHGKCFAKTWLMTFDADDGADVERLRQVLRGIRSIVHTTCKHSLTEPRARVVIMLASPCTSIEDFKRAHTAIRSWLRSQIPGLVIDEGAKDGPRLNFFPMHRPDVTPRFEVTYGKPLDLSRFLSAPKPEATTKPTPNKTRKTKDGGYAAAALRRAREKLGAAAEGERHTTLTKEAWSLARPELDLGIEDIEDALLAVYHDEHDGRRTIRDQFEARRRRGS